jgi:hypothetical protein
VKVEQAPSPSARRPQLLCFDARSSRGLHLCRESQLFRGFRVSFWNGASRHEMGFPVALEADRDKPESICTQKKFIYDRLERKKTVPDPPRDGSQPSRHNILRRRSPPRVHLEPGRNNARASRCLHLVLPSPTTPSVSCSPSCLELSLRHFEC